jgi:hypothetical protein
MLRCSMNCRASCRVDFLVSLSSVGPESVEVSSRKCPISLPSMRPAMRYKCVHPGPRASRARGQIVMAAMAFNMRRWVRRVPYYA